MKDLSLKRLETFIITAKAATYAGNGKPVEPSRPGSKDLWYEDGDLLYRDSYFGSGDFIGEEVVWYKGEPIWAMNYYGYILVPEELSAEESGKVIKESLTALYSEGRFLSGFKHQTTLGLYIDTNEGDVANFHGMEWTERGGKRLYELRYHGGLIR
ncbi:MAG TPA: DUF5680 domain-containing protein [Gaiellaceae bacterium]|jgi:Domain of unknown function (DUF5680)